MTKETEQLRRLVDAREKDEDPAETAYWLFDAKRKGYPPHLHVGERTAFKDVYRAGMSDLRSILERMEKMEAALKPFADAATEAEKWGGAAESVIANSVSLSDCQRAREAFE